MRVLNKFFCELARKYNNELKLSDMVQIMCNTSSMFRNEFLRFCFGQNHIAVDDDGILREYTRNDSRPDFYFKDTTGKEYIIENKIYNRGEPFERYAAAFPNAARAFIANYYASEYEGWSVKTWKDFVKNIEKFIDNQAQNEELTLIKSFIEYLKSVINYNEKPMNLSNLESISHFYEIICELEREMGLRKTTGSGGISAACYGQYLLYNTSYHEYDLWFGLYFTECVGVYIKFRYCQDKNWFPMQAAQFRGGKYFNDATEEDGNLFIALKTEHFAQLCSADVSVDEQKDILRNFLREVLNILK